MDAEVLAMAIGGVILTGCSRLWWVGPDNTADHVRSATASADENNEVQVSERRLSCGEGPAAQPAVGRPASARPSLSAVLRHLGLSLLWANVIPAALFYACFRAGNIWAALIAALVWCYGAMAWRLTTRRRTSGLLWLTAVGLTAKTALTMVTGSTVLYFVQPAVNDGLVAVLFLVSLASARPVVARLAGDFFPMDDDIACRPRVQQLFWRLTLLWAGICAIKAFATVWLLESMRLSTFIALKSVVTPSIALVGAAVTVAIAARVARHEGLLHAAA